MCVTHLLGVYCDGVFLYLHVIANFVYMLEVYCFDVCGTFLMSAILIYLVFLGKSSPNYKTRLQKFLAYVIHKQNVRDP